MPLDVDQYLTEGCGRCNLGGTPNCKVHSWTKELHLLRQIVLSSGLKEEVKWGVPTYTLNGKNVLIIAAFKDYCSINFFKGSLLKDPERILERPGENTQFSRSLKFKSVSEITELDQTIREYLFESIEVEKAGIEPEKKDKPQMMIPEELQMKLDEDPGFKEAFESLTPGRQRGYLLHFTQAKQSKTRLARIEKCIPKILMGKGLQEPI
ncbi:YdeI/OmpD-associated family protein [Algoriphagus machipongonensis]|uniref:YdhG-like domain-containing protein n=1 Tax=Algoriphagus machipongonensis TaxID=388413 RepID=A3I0B6_9BACT|nr:YdeI/OmpD-associated family protein [Algoriphagus machipongonensis]EAZ79912.1 hypothetical protein ALPR1_14824 [Algoriphagus machipongonensis]